MSEIHLPETHGESVVLVKAPVMSSTSREVCVNLLSSDTGGAPAVLGVTFTSPDRWLKRLDAVQQPTAVGIVSMGDTMRSNGHSAGTVNWSPSQEVPTISSVRPGDLTGLGIVVNQYLEAWRNQSWGQGSAELRVCFDSVTTLLQYNQVQTVFRFLNVLTSHLREVQAGAHFHLDPEAHDPQTIATLTSLFDSVIEEPIEE